MTKKLFMNQIQSIIRTSLLSATASIGFFSLTPQPVFAQTISPKLNFWHKIFKPVKDPEPPRKPENGAPRPGKQFCFVPSNTSPRIIWNTKPLLIWQGEINKIALKSIGEKEYLYSKIVTGNQSVNYTGKPLEPGKTYRWLIFLSELENASATKHVSFQVMEAPQRNRIAAELKFLERLQKNIGADAENIAFTKANYFMEKGLWSDALQEAYSVPNPSPELSQIIEDIPNQLCKSK